MLGQCGALVHLDVTANGIGANAVSKLRASWRGSSSDLHIDEDEDVFYEGEDEDQDEEDWEVYQE